MRQRLLLSLIFIYGTISAQLVSTDPAFPTPSNPVTITFNAAEGSQGLMGYTGDVYAHIGVITDKSTSGSDWKYVKTGWGENTPETKLTRVETDLYTITLNPSITEYYGVPDGEKILQIALVFRNEDGSATGKTAEGGDIFVDVYAESLSVSIITPEADILVKQNDEIKVSAASNFADSLILYIDNVRVQISDSSTLLRTITATGEGKHWIKAEAKDATTSVFDSVYYFIREQTIIAELPSGVSNGINYIDDSTVTLVLQAPEKDFTYLIGDFNNWDFSLVPGMSSTAAKQVSATSWMMNKTADNNYHWITVTGLEPMKEYAFQYFVDGEIKIADPYTEKVLDPWNDKYIDEATYPGLIEYPVGKTTEITSVLQTAQAAYEWQVNDFEMPAVENMVIYEMLIRDYVKTHSYKTVADTLDYLKNLGVNVLELMPINEFEGNSSWGYNPSFYFAPDKYYGPKNELKKLVDECHKRGIAVVIDLVLNHSFGQSPLVRLYFENGKPASNNPWYNVDHNFTNPDAHWGYDFNHESIYTQALVDSVNSFWMSVYKVDGFRFDFTKGFSNNIKDDSDPWGSKYDSDRVRILGRMVDEIWKRNPDAYVSFEHLSNNDEETVLANYGINLWGNINYAYNEATMGYNTSGKSDFSWISYERRGWNDPRVVGYMESHDEERLMYKNITYGNSNANYSTKDLNTALSRIELAANFFITIPGPKMIWQFGELGYDISIDENGRVGEKPIKWEYFDDKNRRRLYDVYGALAKLKVEEAAFSTDDFDLSVYGATKTIHLNHTDMNVAIIGNFDIVENAVNPKFQNTGTWYEYYSAEVLDVTNTEAEITLAPGEYRLYTTKQLDQPDITPSVGEIASSVVKGGLNIYPNPVNDELFIADGQNLVSISIYNVIGKMVFTNLQVNQIHKVNVSDLDKGVYIISGTDKNGITYTSRFVKK